MPAGNPPLKSENTALLNMVRLEEFDHAGATALAVVFLAAAFVLVVLLHRESAWGGAGRRA